MSIAVHLLFGAVATIWVVQRTLAKRKLTFTAAPPSANPGHKEAEHKVSMAKKQKVMSAPMENKRVTTTGLSKVSLPEMPALSSMSSQAAPSKMAGMAGDATGLASAAGVATMPSGGGGGGPIPFFGARSPESNGGGLVGTFYDLKQMSSKAPSPFAKGAGYYKEVGNFINSGWSTAFLKKYYKASTSIYASQILVPPTASVEAPKAFGVEKEVEPRFWAIHYKGKVSPPTDGTYHFAGSADNFLVVRIAGRIALATPANYAGHLEITQPFKADQDIAGFIVGPGIQLSAKQAYDIDIVIGDDGGSTWFQLMYSKDGTSYQKDTKTGIPILNVFQISRPAKKPEKLRFQCTDSSPVWTVPNPIFSH